MHRSGWLGELDAAGADRGARNLCFGYISCFWIEKPCNAAGSVMRAGVSRGFGGPFVTVPPCENLGGLSYDVCSETGAAKPVGCFAWGSTVAVKRCVDFPLAA